MLRDDVDLNLCVRTVCHAATYLEELKQAAQNVAQQIAASPRGYFTPIEEDATLGLLISYWQIRTALFELIENLRQEHRDREPPPAAFLVGLAAAVVLVDAARFLRELAEHRPVIRRKLNEPSLPFGIPAGVYDQVQRSLISARHGWHLHRAAEFFCEQKELLLAEARARQIESLIEIIERRMPRLDVTIAQFVRAKIQTRTRQVASRIQARLFGRALYSVQKIVGILLANKYVRIGHQPSLPAPIADELLRQLQPGDVLLVRKEFALTNYFLPGYWPHAAVYLGNRADISHLLSNPALDDRVAKALQRIASHSPGVVLEAMKDGVNVRSIESPFRSDSIVVLRPQLSPTAISMGLMRGLSHEGKPYDFDFDFRRSDRLVCTEVVYRAFDGMEQLTIPLVSRAGRPTLSGSDLIENVYRNQNFRPVATFAPRIVPNLCLAAESRALIEAAQSSG